MIRRDYLLRIIQEFFEALAKALQKNEKEIDKSQAQGRFNKMYEQFFRQQPEYFYLKSKEEIWEELEDKSNDEQDALSWAQMLANLMYHDALIQDYIPDRILLLEKSLFLFQIIDRKGKTYSFERINKMEEIQKLMDEFDAG